MNEQRGIPVTNLSAGGACLAALFLLISPLWGQYQTVRIPVGSGPGALASNPATHRVYVADQNSNDVEVIDADPNSPSFNTVIAGPIAVGSMPDAIAVNSATNRIYVANRNSGNVSVIDGGTNTVVATIPVNIDPFHPPSTFPFHPAGLAINQNTNQIYVANLDCAFAAIDGRNNVVRHPNFPGLCGQLAVAVNPNTNRVYVAAKEDADIQMFDERLQNGVFTNTLLANFDASQPAALAVDPWAGRIYGTDLVGGVVEVIDEPSKKEIAKVQLANTPYALAANSLNTKAFVLNQNGVGDPAIVSVIAGTGLQANLTVGRDRLPIQIPAPNKVLVDASGNKVYVANDASNDVTVIDGNTDQILFTFPTDSAPVALAADDSTGNVYVANFVSGTVTAFELAPAATNLLSRTSLAFGSQAVGANSEAQFVTVINRGRTDLIMGNIVPAGDFTKTDNCQASNPIHPGGTCTIQVVFSPTTTGTRMGSLTINDSDPSNPQTVNLSGSGIAAGIRIAPASLTFGSQIINTLSGQQAVTVTNTGGAPLVFQDTSTQVTGDFDWGDDCTPNAPPPATKLLQPGDSCTVAVNFYPQAGGARPGQLTITDYSSGSGVDYVVPLFGYGTSVQGVRLLASSASFGSQVVGTTSAAQVVTLTNHAFTDLVVSKITVDGDYAIGAENCTAGRVAPNVSCEILVTFTPTAAGMRSGQIIITDNQNYSPQFVGLTGTGTPQQGVTLSPSSISFGTQAGGGTFGPMRTITLTNNGANDLTISSITPYGDSAYQETDNCQPTVPAGGSCTIQVAYDPNSHGFTAVGQIVIVDSDPASPHFVALSGPGTGLNFLVSPSFLNSAGGTVTVTDGYFQPLITSIVAIGEFTETHNCQPDYSSCTINVTSAPSGGTGIGQITIDDVNHPEISPAVVALAPQQ